MAGTASTSKASPTDTLLRVVVLTLAALAAAALLGSPAAAFAGQAASGELLFYPCTTCHPITGRTLPNGFKGHEVRLVGHDVLGKGDAACLVCHDDPKADPGKLKLADGSLVDIKGDTARVCYRCHSAKYKEFVAGAHGKGQPRCTASGCHDPHTPQWIYAGPLMPFTGAGFQFKVLSQREAFAALAQPPVDPAVEVPRWFAALAAVVLLGIAVQLAVLIRGRQER